MTITTPSLHPYINRDRPLLGRRTPGVLVLTHRPLFITYLWIPCEPDRRSIGVRGLGLLPSSEGNQSRLVSSWKHHNLNGRVLLLFRRRGHMSTNSSRSEALILDALRGGDPILLEQITERIPELSWNELFQVVDILSRRGDLILRRRGFAYYLSLPRMSQVSA